MQILLTYHRGFIFMLILLSIGSIDTAFCQLRPPITIAFASDIDGDWEIYLTNSDGKIHINLTEHGFGNKI